MPDSVHGKKKSKKTKHEKKKHNQSKTQPNQSKKQHNQSKKQHNQSKKQDKQSNKNPKSTHNTQNVIKTNKSKQFKTIREFVVSSALESKTNEVIELFKDIGIVEINDLKEFGKSSKEWVLAFGESRLFNKFGYFWRQKIEVMINKFRTENSLNEVQFVETLKSTPVERKDDHQELKDVITTAFEDGFKALREDRKEHFSLLEKKLEILTFGSLATTDKLDSHGPSLKDSFRQRVFEDYYRNYPPLKPVCWVSGRPQRYGLRAGHIIPRKLTENSVLVNSLSVDFSTAFHCQDSRNGFIVTESLEKSFELGRYCIVPLNPMCHDGQFQVFILDKPWYFRTLEKHRPLLNSGGNLYKASFNSGCFGSYFWDIEDKSHSNGKMIEIKENEENEANEENKENKENEENKENKKTVMACDLYNETKMDVKLKRQDFKSSKNKLEQAKKHLKNLENDVNKNTRKIEKQKTKVARIREATNTSLQIWEEAKKKLELYTPLREGQESYEIYTQRKDKISGEESRIFTFDLLNPRKPSPFVRAFVKRAEFQLALARYRKCIDDDHYLLKDEEVLENCIQLSKHF